MHDPLRVAEEWALVDNLSGGRVDMGVVPGWNPNDYVLAPAAYANRWPEVFERLDIVRRLWRGDAVLRTNGHGDEVPTRVHPRPIQRELPVWIATSANDQSFTRAGELGLNVLTALLIQSVDEFARRVRLYREARARAGHDPADGRVTLMVHTCIGESDAQVRGVVREPFLAYMQTVQSLWKDTVDALRTETAVAQDRLLDMVFERYFQKSTLFGSLETCLARARDFELAGATELACMIDFGLGDTRSELGLARTPARVSQRGSPAVASTAPICNRLARAEAGAPKRCAASGRRRTRTTELPILRMSYDMFMPGRIPTERDHPVRRGSSGALRPAAFETPRQAAQRPENTLVRENGERLAVNMASQLPSIRLPPEVIQATKDALDVWLGVSRL
jgi:natural product biosynthesis luciferase-like monooxygenase protein